MNDLKDKKDEVKKYITFQIDQLFKAYDQDLDVIKFKQCIAIIVNELSKKQRLDKTNLDNAYNELLYNFTFYKRINAASYLTAFNKSNKR